MPGLTRGKQELAARTLTPLILVRIQVPQPNNLVILTCFIDFASKAVTLRRDAVFDWALPFLGAALLTKIR